MLEPSTEKAIRNLARHMKKLSSLSWNFWRGVFYGFGFFIGSALLAAFFIYLLTRVGSAPLLGRIANQIVEVLRQK